LDVLSLVQFQSISISREEEEEKKKEKKRKEELARNLEREML
jgi:hypothetical protein